eukprot:23403_1
MGNSQSTERESKVVTDAYLSVYEKLINMEFDEELSLDAAIKFPNNVNDAINYIEQNQQKKQIQHNQNNSSKNDNDHKQNDNKLSSEPLEDVKIDTLQKKSEEIDLFHLNFNWKEFRKNTKSNNEKYDDKFEQNEMCKDIIQQWITINKQNNHNHTQNCELKASSCLFVKRLILILKTYHSWCDNIENADDINNISILDIVNYLYSKISVTDGKICLFNDYCHMFEFHVNTEEFWFFIKNNLTECNSKKCKFFLRNHRNRDNFRGISARKALYFGYEKSNDVISIQFLDRLHAYLCHSNVNVQGWQTCDIALTSSTKFVTDITQDEDEKTSTHKATSKSAQVTEYSFGVSYKYWDSFRKKATFCTAKYSNLKHEMMNNKVFTVSEHQWNDTLEKALQIKMSDKGQSLKAIYRGGVNKKYDIPYKMPISLSHIMVLLFYCNFDSLQRKFKQECRPIHRNETRESLNKRNSEIGHWFSFLKEVCWFYGQAMKEDDVFYHGINRTLLFNQLHARFRFPLSTTSSLTVASIFANQKIYDENNDDENNDDDYIDNDTSTGIIMELGYCELCFYIDVESMSDFPNEKERLFFGADLQIKNIYYKNKSHKNYISALTLFESIIHGQFFVDILKDNALCQQALLKMINNLQWNTRLNDEENIMMSHNIQYCDDIPGYMQDLFEYFYNSPYKMWAIKSQLKYLDQHLRNYFEPICTKHELNNENTKQNQYILNLAGKHDNVPSYPLKYSLEHIWNLTGNEFIQFQSLQSGSQIFCKDEIIYDNNEDCVMFKFWSRMSTRGKYSLFVKVNKLSENIKKVLFGFDLFCPQISFKTSYPRKWYAISDYSGYTMFSADKVKNLKEKHFQWHIAIKTYNFKRETN